MIVEKRKRSVRRIQKSINGTLKKENESEIRKEKMMRLIAREKLKRWLRMRREKPKKRRSKKSKRDVMMKSEKGLSLRGSWN